MWHISLVWMAGACRSPEVPPVPLFAQAPPLALTVQGPLSGAFVGDVATVFGWVNDPAANVFIEGYRVNVGRDGAFRVQMPIDAIARVLDVEAIRPDAHLRERIIVYSGVDPLTDWTGGMGVRVTPLAFAHLGELLEVQLEALGLADLISGVVPEFSLGGWSFVPTAVVVPPLNVQLVPHTGAVVATVDVGRIEVWVDVVGPNLTVPLVLGLDGAAIEVAAAVAVDAQGALTFALTDTQIAMGAPVFEVGGIDPDVLEAWAGGVTTAIAGVLEGLLDATVGALGEVALPLGPIQTDALGFPLALAVVAVDTDADGTAVVLSVDTGLVPTAPLRVPTLAEATPRADVALSLHEGLLQGLLDSTLASALTLDLELPGFLGEIVALPVAALPGGGALPGDRTAMCLAVDPGTERVARLAPEEDGLAPFLSVVMPDVRLLVSVSTPGVRCMPWLDASLFVRADFVAEGTVLVPEISVIDGAVLDYAASDEAASDEAAIIAGLGGLVDAAMGLLGGADLAIDLGTLFPPTLGLSPRLLDASPMQPSGDPAEGSVILTLSLWD